MVRSMPCHRIRYSASRLVVLMTLLTFVCRAFIPMGYMPTPVHGVPGLTFCLSNGDFKSIALDRNGGDIDTSPRHEQLANDSCPFSLLAAQIMLPPAGATFSTDLDPTVTSVAFAKRDARTPLTRGPPLGSRAPPSFI